MFESLKLGLLRLRLRARGLLELPSYKGSVLRGGFGSAFRGIACPQRAEVCDGCLVRGVCPYAYVFETSPPFGAEVLRTLKDVPRPFVLEPPTDDRTTYEAGEEFSFGLVTIGQAVKHVPYFVAAFRELGRTGIGPRRTGFELVDVNQAEPTASPVGSWSGGYSALGTGQDGRLQLRLSDAGWVRRASILDLAEGLPDDRVRLRFETMTRLKSDDVLDRRPSFQALARALLRRVSSLAYFHHGQQLDVDYADLVASAGEVRVVEDATRWGTWVRYSNRQSRRMDFGGFVGEIAVEGDLSPFKELLVLGALVHVGKNTTFGLGKFTLPTS